MKTVKYPIPFELVEVLEDVLDGMTNPSTQVVSASDNRQAIIAILKALTSGTVISEAGNNER